MWKFTFHVLFLLKIHQCFSFSKRMLKIESSDFSCLEMLLNICTIILGHIKNWQNSHLMEENIRNNMEHISSSITVSSLRRQTNGLAKLSNCFLDLYNSLLFYWISYLSCVRNQTEIFILLKVFGKNRKGYHSAHRVPSS